MENDISFENKPLFGYDNLDMIREALKNKSITLSLFQIQTILQNADTGDIITAQVEYSRDTCQYYSDGRMYRNRKTVSFYLCPWDFKEFTIYDEIANIANTLPLKLKILIRTIYLIYMLETENKFSDEAKLNLATRLQLKDRDVNIIVQPVSSFWAF